MRRYSRLRQKKAPRLTAISGAHRNQQQATADSDLHQRAAKAAQSAKASRTIHLSSPASQSAQPANLTARQPKVLLTQDKKICS